MKKLRLSASLILVACFASVSLSVSATGDRTDEIIKKLEAQIPALMDKALIPGLSIALIEDGKVVWSKPYGVLKAGENTPVEANTIFEAASLSKPVFAYGVMKLVEQGLLDLDKPFVDIVGKEYLFGLGTKYQTDDARFDKLTARTVLTHSTGFPNWFRNNPLSIAFEPGSRFSYSGEAFDLLARVVEKITGKTIVEFLQETVFDPLQMNNSSYVWRDDYEGRFPPGHTSRGVAQDRRRATEPRMGATLYTTATDYAKLLMALINNTGLRPDTVSMMLSRQIPAYEDQIENIFWGLGVGLNVTDQGTYFWHWGDNGNFKCYFEASKDKRAGIVFFTNSSNCHAISEYVSQIALGLGRPAILAQDYPKLDSSEIQANYLLAHSTYDEALAEIKNRLASGEQDRNKIEAIVYNIGTAAFMAGDIESLQTVSSFAIKNFPEGGESNRLGGVVRLLSGDTAGGLTLLEKSYQANPDQENILNTIGYALLRAGMHDNAIEVLKFTVSKYPESANCYDSLGEAYWRAKDYDNAVINYKLALEKDANFASATAALAAIEEERKTELK